MPYVNVPQSRSRCVFIDNKYEVVSHSPRLVKKGERFVMRDEEDLNLLVDKTGDDNVLEARVDFHITERIVVRVKETFKWPEWLAAKWIARDRNGKWFACNDEPALNTYTNAYYAVNGVYVPLEMTTFKPPVNTGTTKMRNPNVPAEWITYRITYRNNTHWCAPAYVGCR